MMALLTLLAALSPLSAQEASPCRQFRSLGCLYAPEGAADLIVYLRGWYQGSGTVAPEARLASARQAFDRYKLKAVADERQAMILVSGSSHQGVGPEDLAAVEDAAGKTVRRVFLVSHSGGYVGLEKTLDGLGRADRILMLDNFYFGADLAKKVQRQVQRGSTCAGFFTDHNKKRVAETFKPVVYCPVEPHDDYGHDEAVTKCLGTYLKQDSCP